jgi:cytochrome c
VVLTEDNLVVFLTPKPFDPIGNLRDEFLAQTSLSDDAIASFDDALSECVRCHTLQYGAMGSGPSLVNVFENPIASSSFGNYSAALSKKGGVWTREALRQFLKDPQAFAPGSAMPSPEINNDETLTALVEFIAQLNDAARAD